MPDKSLRRPAQLAAAGLLPAERVAALEAVAARYAVAITPEMADLIERGDHKDPIARQFIPESAELVSTPEERADPIGDAAHSPLPGIVHRYPDRVLLKLVGVCAVYCRYCFRREQIGGAQGGVLPPRALDAALAYIACDPRIWEVILTGGDPLVLSARRLRAVGRQIAAMGHVKVLRVHSRVPIVAPQRITAATVAALKAEGLATFLVVHANHPRELTPAARAACGRFVDAGIPVLSQSVLLRGVNDDAGTLEALMRGFVEARIKPYYLHHADLAPGTAHFRTGIGAGQALMRALRGRVSGLCQPTYVLDIPGGHGKVPIGPCYLRAGDGAHDVEDVNGRHHRYPPPAAE
jgi:lysine 2,3-aminomutase